MAPQLVEPLVVIVFRLAASPSVSSPSHSGQGQSLWWNLPKRGSCAHNIKMVQDMDSCHVL
jgi:hypothetical protein